MRSYNSNLSSTAGDGWGYTNSTSLEPVLTTELVNATTELMNTTTGLTVPSTTTSHTTDIVLILIVALFMFAFVFFSVKNKCSHIKKCVFEKGTRCKLWKTDGDKARVLKLEELPVYNTLPPAQVGCRLGE
ncbi:hypothetical protein [Candidatus Ichthyocystis hellenicum]|uniref:hypothetical protein n=1 Tax=Candidatus Ichthyocystis hellenicum TaxID=1561003 RepID=UPI000B8047FF|nr:hypothetical protein [Candidatus Ichthyocystis hellenicum]